MTSATMSSDWSYNYEYKSKKQWGNAFLFTINLNPHFAMNNMEL